MNKLNDKQKMFCKEYIIDLNATQAAIRAGYSKKSARIQASKMLTKGNISTYMNGLLEKKSDKLNITAEYVLGNIKSIGEKCMAADDKENPALKAQELLGRHIKLFGEDATDTSRPIVIMPTIKMGDKEITFDIGSEPDSS